MLTDVYYMLRDGTEFHDLGDQYFAQRHKVRQAATGACGRALAVPTSARSIPTSTKIARIDTSV
jgi:hypothetical protein